jgi:hypothetical protein
MPEVVTDIIIDASAERVWQVLTDLPSYPTWNPVLRQVVGDLGIEQTLDVVRIGANGREVAERPTIVHYRPMRDIYWRVRLGLPGLLDVERGFKIERLGPEQVRFVHWEARSGLFAYLVRGASESDTRGQLDVMNLALKAQAEHGAVAYPDLCGVESTDVEARADHEQGVTAAPI